ncbi:MAG: MFS transporter [Phycisphaerales bacterium]|nr:MFS transporter [Phycisphaerales bacterium]
MTAKDHNGTHPLLPAKKIGLLAIGAMLLFYFYQQIIENSYAPLRLEIGQDLGLSTLETAFISTAFLIAFAVVQIPAGVLIDRFGPARLLPVVAITTGFAAAFLSKCDGLSGAIMARALLGATAAFACPAIAVITRRTMPLHLFALFMGIADMVIGLGGVVGVWGGNELQTATNWRVALQIISIVAVPLALLLYMYVPPTWFGASTHKQVEGQKKLSIIATIKDLFALADVRVACLIYAGSCGTLCGFGGMWNMQLAESWAWNESEAVFIASSFFVGIAIGSPITGWFGVKFGSRGTILISMWITLPAFLFWLLVPTDWPLWFDTLNVGLIGAGLSAMALAFEIAGRSLPPERVGSAIAVVNLAGISAGVLLEIIPGLIEQFVNASPLHQMQLANGVFAFMLAFTIWATLKVRPAS